MLINHKIVVIIHNKSIDKELENINRGFQNSGTVTFNFRNMSIHGEYAFGR